MGRHPDSDSGQSGGDNIRNGGEFLKQNGKGTRPESIHQRERRIRNGTEAIELGTIMNMNDQGIIRRASFGSKNREHGIRVERIGAKAVDRFRREGNQLA